MDRRIKKRTIINVMICCVVWLLLTVDTLTEIYREKRMCMDWRQWEDKTTLLRLRTWCNNE